MKQNEGENEGEKSPSNESSHSKACEILQGELSLSFGL